MAFGREPLDGYAAHVRDIHPDRPLNSRPKPVFSHETGESMQKRTNMAFGRELLKHFRQHLLAGNDRRKG